MRWVVGWLVLCGPAVAAGACGDRSSTQGIVECLAAETRVWDLRLNEGYGALMRSVVPGQREPLRAAQRLWVAYRDANCRFYAVGEGTISRVEAADCLRGMTEQRALELERAGH